MKQWLDYTGLEYRGEANHGAYYRADPPGRLGHTGRVLLKVLYDSASDHQWKSVAREISLLSSLRSEFIAPLLDAGHDHGRLFYAMDYPVLGTLQEPAHALSLTEKLDALESGARGLHAVHGAGVIHRDFKPAKIFMAETGGRLTDLGTADETQERQGRAVPTGSLAYMAPEVARGDHSSVQSDVFSLGASVYAVLTGHEIYPALPRRNIVSALGYVAGANPVPDVAALPGPLQDVVCACLSPRPDDRPATADEVARAIGMAG